MENNNAINDSATDTTVDNAHTMSAQERQAREEAMKRHPSNYKRGQVLA